MPLQAENMAQAIEDAFRDQWKSVMGEELPQDNPQTKLLFVAIAQGIITYLAQNSNSFKVTVNLPDNDTATGTVSEIQVITITSNNGELS